MGESAELPDINPILQLGASFAASRVLLTAVELELFTHLSETPLTASQIAEKLRLHPRAVPDFPDALVALDLLKREGDGSEGLYSNAPAAEYYLVKGSAAYRGGLLEMCAKRLYSFWGHLTEALQTGQPQNEIHARNGGTDLWEAMYGNDELLEGFINAMTSNHTDGHRKFAEIMDWGGVNSHLDVGGASGQLSCEVVKVHPHVKSITFDLERVSIIAARNIESQGLSERVETMSGSFWEMEFPKVDMITMGQILHDYNLEKKVELLKKSYVALNEGGRFVALEYIIDDDRRGSVPALLMSLNMLIDQDGGFDYSASDFDGWAKQVGFKRTECVDLVPPMRAVIAYK